MILAGGRATRMGGGDKGRLKLGGESLIARIVDRLRPQIGALAINANGDPARLADLGLTILPDPVAGQPGPLAGILAALDWAAGLGAARVLTVPADTPFLPADLARNLSAAAGPDGAALAATAGPAGRIHRHPTCALWPVAARGALRAALDGGLRRLDLWAELQGAAVATWAAEPFDPFFNVNTPEDLARAEALLSRTGTG